MASFSFYIFFVLLYFNLPYNYADQNQQQQCPVFTCGSFGQVGFPFVNTNNPEHPDCGGSLILNCTDPVPKIQFSKQGGWYPVLNMSYSDKRIAIHDLYLQDQLDTNHCNALKITEPFTSSVHFSLATPAFPLILCNRSKSHDSSQGQFFQSFQNFTACIDDYDVYFTKDYNITVPPLPDRLLNRCVIHRLPRFQYGQNVSNRAYSAHEVSAMVELESTPITYESTPITYGTANTRVYITPNSQGSNSSGGTPYITPKSQGSNPSGGTPYITPKSQGSNSSGEPYQKGKNSTTGNGQNPSEASRNLTYLSNARYTLRWEINQDCNLCQLKGGLCQEDENGNFRCGGLKGTGKGRRLEIIIASAISIAAFLVIMIILYCCIRKKYLTTNSVVFRKRSKNAQFFEDFLRNHASLTPKRYSYSDIRKMTNSFKDKLGEGGYGGVFKGKLPDGRFIAVKVLKESKGNGEDFVNEVASISRTSHVNIVSLLGFCSKGSKRALVYEFMPNGSLDKFIYNKSSNTMSCSPLSLEMLYEIAIGIARGLEYLHRGCSTRIVHFDIKPHNILLDENFSPKISDFGLAKLCQRKKSIMSMLGARGTVGYIAPELVYVHHGGVSYKSDVYSYGMMVLEMVGGRHNTEVGVDQTSEIYFPYWIHQRLEQEDDLRLHGITSEAEREIAKKMILVGLWCVQPNPSDRPSMNRVLEMLEGSLESLEIPPKPFLYPPERSPVDSPAN